MQERYLYRGKTISGNWVQGLLANKDNKWYISNKAGVYEFAYEIRPDTICQCIGLKDKSGKLIFENDIMEGYIDEDFPEDVSRFEVEWSGNGWVINQPGCTDREYISDFETENYEVVGNSFDNPELLEV